MSATVAGILWWLKLPCTPILLLGMIVAGAAARMPEPASGRKTDEPDPKAMRRYHRWKDMLAGITPNKDWITIRRVSWWTGWLIGPLVTPASAHWITLVLNLLCGFPLIMGLIHSRDRAADRRHVYKGVSVTTFIGKASPVAKLIAFTPTVLLLAACTAAWWLDYLPPIGIIVYPTSLFLLLVWITGRKPQSNYWHDLVDMQQLIDKWAGSDDLKKAWAGAYVTQVDRVGDQQNPLTVVRIRLQGSDRQNRSVDEVFKLGEGRIKAPAAADGYQFVCLLGAKEKGGGFQFAASSFRLLLGKDQTCIPDITRRDVGEKTAQLACDIAYAKTAITWHKRAPLTQAHDVSDDDQQGAWLLEIHLPPEGGDPIDKISFDWLGADGNPSTTLHMPVFADLQDAFHLVADPATPLSDKGNKWRPDGVTLKRTFQEYVDTSRRYRDEQKQWADLVGKLGVPMTIYDGEETHEKDGSTISLLPLVFTAPDSAADYARLDLRPLNPQARFIGVIGEGRQGWLVTATGGISTRIEELTGRESYIRQYAQAIMYKALLDALPSKTEAVIDSCTQAGRDVAIWRIKFHLERGATIMDVRKQSAHIASSVGATRVYWDWISADKADVWLCREPYLGVADLRHWQRRPMQKQLIQLALSEAWGVAGVADNAGRTPTVVSLGVLPQNHDVLLARFEIPAGLDIDKPEHNIGKFMTSADYGYGRILPRGEEHGATMYDMVLAKRSPFPTMVKADWDFARRSKPRMFPLGVDDMGKPVYWNVKDTFHLLVCGKSGTGKSSAAQIVVAEALLKGHAIILVDPSKGCIDFTQWAKPLALAFVGLGQMRETEAVIAWLRHEMAERVKLFSRYGVGSIYDLDKSRLTPDELKHVQPIDLVFDEFNSYLQEAGKTTQNPNKDIQLANDNAAVSAINNSIRRTMSALGKIVVQGRTAGISVILGAQRLTMDDMKPYNATAFFRSLGRILLGMDSTAGVVSQQNLREANRLQQSLKGEGGRIPQGRGIFETAQGELLAVQTWYSGGQEELVELFKDHPKPEPIDYTPYLPAEAEKYGEVSEDELSKLLNQPAGDTEGEEISNMDELTDVLHAGKPDDTDGDAIEEVDW